MARPEGGSRSRRPRRLRLALPAILLAGLFAGLFAIVDVPAARAAEVFTVRDVVVDATADTAARARDEALASGQVTAFNRLLSRIALAADRDKVPPLGSEAVSDMVRDFEVADEKTSAVRYLASLTVRFKPDVVRAFLRGHGIGFAETSSKPVLVLPVFEVTGALSLWDEPNPWREAWRHLPPSDGLVPLVQAMGDLQDVALIGAEQAVRGDDRRLAAIAARYGASDVLVTRAGMRYSGGPAEGGSGPWLQVSLSRFGTAQLEQTRIEAFYPQPGEDMEALLQRAAAGIARQVEETWKRNNRLRFDTGDELTVEVPLTSLNDWVEVKSRLENVAFIRESDLIYLSRKVARLRLNFMGDEEQLRLALTQSDLTLERGPTSLVLRLGGDGPGNTRP